VDPERSPCPPPLALLEEARRWHFCRPRWVEARVASEVLRFLAFEATAQAELPDPAEPPSEGGGQVRVSVLGFLEARPAATAPGGHALLAAYAYGWGARGSLRCGIGRVWVPADILLDPPHALRVECRFPRGLLDKGRRVSLRLADGEIGLRMQVELCRMQKPRHAVSICTMPLFPPLPESLVKEWIDHHHHLGVGHVYLYDRFGSFGSALKGHLKAGTVSHIEWPLFHHAMHHPARLSKYYDQILAATACVMRAGGDGWVAYLDPDEFMHPGDRRHRTPQGGWATWLHRLLSLPPAPTHPPLSSARFAARARRVWS